MKLILVGDIVGKSGRRALKALLPNVVERYNLDLVIVNGENAAGGFGITEKVAEEMFQSGVHVITGGNHIWDKKEAVKYLDREKRVLRPLNYPPSVPGFGKIVHKFSNGTQVVVINIAGRVFMQNLDCPFRAMEREIENLKGVSRNIIVDFHAEATSEKLAFGHFLDGKVSAVLCTHTHVQTADEKILPGGTAYITDVGMTGPENSIIGMEKEIVFGRFLTQMPIKFEAAKGDAVFSAVVVEIDLNTGKSSAIRRIQLTYP
jgi:metallophosphoesterase (TIGR00282 family)